MFIPTPTTTTPTTRRGPHGLVGFVAVIAVALQLLAVANARSAPATSRQDDGTNPTCDVASPAASPESTPVSGSNRIDRVISSNSQGEIAPASPEVTPTSTPCFDSPTGEELLATAAALLEAATAEAAAQASPTSIAPAPTESAEAGEVTQALPGADIPSTNVQGFSFNLEASLAADLAAVVTEAPVYRLNATEYDAEAVTALAAT